MKKIMIITVLIVLVGSTVGAFLWVDNMIAVSQENDVKTSEIDSRIRQLFVSESIFDYPYQPEKVTWGNNYLLFEGTASNGANIKYDMNWNEKLQTSANYPGKDVKGIIVLQTYFKEVGEYVNSSGVKIGTATQYNYVVNYFDMDKKTIIAKDTLYGDDPDSKIRNSSGDLGDAPDDEVVLESIKKRLK
ncbi:MAG: hypothetical protein RSD71_11610 [Flavobacterium sp.]|uniref:hypothetical protein n=1 Tax=Flavobacterium sp. TaxID=239 RepID=UPI002FCC01E8